jgi:hypothetical protein
MTSRSIGMGFAALLLLILGGGAGFLLGGNHWLGKLSVATVTPDQIATAMSNDDFWGTYRENTLIVNGSVASVTQQSGDTQIELTTSTIFKVYCDIGSAATSVKSGDPIKILAEAFPAKRLPSGVLLTGCTIL